MNTLHKNSISPVRTISLLMLTMFVFAIPWENLILVQGVGTIGRILGIICSLFFFYLLISEKCRPLNKFHFLIFIFLLWTVATFLWAFDTKNSLIHIKTLFQVVVFIWIMWELGSTEKSIKMLMSAYVLGSYVSIFFIVKSYIKDQSIYYNRYSAIGFDPNDLGLILAIGVPIAWYLFSNSKFRFRFIFLPYIPLACMSVVLTASRGAFISLCMALLLIPFSLKGKSLGFKLITLFTIISTFLALTQVIPNSSWFRIFTIINEFNGGNLNSRLDIWKNASVIFSEHPLIGVGSGSFPLKISQIYGALRSTHNSYISILVETGLVGFFVFMLIVGKSLKDIFGMEHKERLLFTFLLLTLAVGSFGLEWDLRKPTWFVLALLNAFGASSTCISIKTESYYTS